jgi:hypothetical protein
LHESIIALDFIFLGLSSDKNLPGKKEKKEKKKKKTPPLSEARFSSMEYIAYS